MKNFGTVREIDIHSEYKVIYRLSVFELVDIRGIGDSCRGGSIMLTKGIADILDCI